MIMMMTVRTLRTRMRNVEIIEWPSLLLNSDDGYNTNTNLVILAGHRKYLHHNHINLSKAIEMDDDWDCRI